MSKYPSSAFDVSVVSLPTLYPYARVSLDCGQASHISVSENQITSLMDEWLLPPDYTPFEETDQLYSDTFRYPSIIGLLVIWQIDCGFVVESLRDLHSFE